MKALFVLILFASWLHASACISISELVRTRNDGLHAISDRQNGPFKSGFGGVKLPLNLSDLQYHGTTTLSFKHQDCVIVCVDSKASVGDYVGSRTVRKVFPVAKSIVATMAGGAADCEHWIRRISRDAKAFEYQYDAELNAKAIARLLSSALKERHRAREELSVGTMVAGWAKAEGPSLFYVDSEGLCIEGDMFCVGSGSQFAYAILDSAEDSAPVENKPFSAEDVATAALDPPSQAQSHRSSVLSRLPLQDAISTAVKAVRHATYRDGFSGGYINVLVVNATGIHHVRRVDSRTIPI